MIQGRCECSQVAFTVKQPRETITICHCSQCRRTSGHVWASTHAPYGNVDFTCDDGLVWYDSSPHAKRGFCKFCGSSLFYRMNGETGIGIATGCLETTHGMRVGKHIFVADKGDYYPVPGDAPVHEKG